MSLEIIHFLCAMASEYSTQFSLDDLAGLITTFDEFAKLHVAHSKVCNRIILTSVFVEVAESLACSITNKILLFIELA